MEASRRDGRAGARSRSKVRPRLRKYCKSAMPSTRPGIINGDVAAAARTPAPGTIRRTIAIPASVPIASEIAVERSAISSESHRAGQKPSSEPTAAYQRSDAPPTGKSNTGVGEKLESAMITSGARRKTDASAITMTARTRAKAPVIGPRFSLRTGGSPPRRPVQSPSRSRQPPSPKPDRAGGGRRVLLLSPRSDSSRP